MAGSRLPMSLPNRAMSMLPHPFNRRAPEPKQTDQNFNLFDRLQSKEVDPQLDCPFYNGRIPAEIRTIIFEYALTDSPSPNALRFSHDTAVRHDHEPAPMPELPIELPFEKRDYTISETAFYDDESRKVKAGFDWLRPDNTRPMSSHYGLLLTCRRVYLESHALPLQQKEFVFYGLRGAENGWLDSNPYHYFRVKLNRPSSTPGRSQRELYPKSVRLFTQLFWLEDRTRYLDRWRPSSETWYAPLENLRITLRRGDWWDWERNQPLKISPYRRSVNSAADMHADMARLAERERSGNKGPADDQAEMYEREAWGLAFQSMTNLKTLVIEFETAEDKKSEMERIVGWAVKWRFPLATNGPSQQATTDNGQSDGDSDGDSDDSGQAGGCERGMNADQETREHESRDSCPRFLTADDVPVQKMSWRGTKAYWSTRCTSCPADQPAAAEYCVGCRQRQRLENNGLGPRLYVWKVTWRAVTADEILARQR